MMKYKLSSSADKVLKKLKEFKRQGLIEDLHKLSVIKAREEFKKIRGFFSFQESLDEIWVNDFYINNIEVRHYRGKNNHKDKLLPVMIYFHGGGWVLGDLDTHDQICRKMAHKAEFDVLAINYSLAPEFIFPKAVEDGYEVLSWLINEKHKLKINKNKIIICGDSAGGNIVAVLSHLNRDSIKAKIILQVLIYPATDFSNLYKSKLKYDGLILSKKLIEWFEYNYLPNKIRNIYFNDWRLSPLKAPNFRDLPDSFIALAECDPLFDEGYLYAKRLKKMIMLLN